MKNTIRSGAAVAAVVGTVALIACSGSGSPTGASEQAVGEGTDGGTDGATATDAGACPSAAPTFSVCSDAQVASIIHTVDQAEIQLAQALQGKLQSNEAKSFAQRMISDHGALESALQSLGFTSFPDNGITMELQDEAQAALQSLQQKSGTDLDKAYIDHELVDHLKVLGHIDHLLGPSIKDPRLAAAAPTARNLFVTHTQLAVAAQTALEGACGGPQAQDGGTSGGDGGASTDGGGTTDAGGTTGDAGAKGDAGGTTGDAGSSTGDGGGASSSSGGVTL